MLAKDLITPVGEPAARGLWTFTATIVVLLALLVGLPLAVWLDLRNLTDRSLVKQATELGRVIDGIRDYYSGVEKPFRVRMGINTGFCDVGNFGSEDRMEYTIIGAEANLSARLQTIAEAGGIVISYETYALVRDVVRARPLASITMKGVSRTIVPYVVEGLVGEEGQREQVVSEHATGLDLFLDTRVIEGKDEARAVAALKEALAALEARRGSGPSEPPA